MSHSRSLVEVNPSMKIIKELSYEELLQQEASRLPERETMDLISLNLAAPTGGRLTVPAAGRPDT